MPDYIPPKLTLPGGGTRHPASDLPSSTAPGDKLILRPRELTGAVGPATNPAGEESTDATKKSAAPMVVNLASERIRRSAYRRWQGWIYLGIACAALTAGYLLGQRHAEPAVAVTERPTPISAPTAAEQAELDAAFLALRSAHYADARRQFVELARKHPQWKTLNNKIATCALAEGDSLGFKRIVEQGEAMGTIRPDETRLLLSQLFMVSKDYENADRLFGESVGADPIRAETYYYWGDCLLSWGKPKEAAEKFRAGQLRNIYPAAETLFETKLWLAEVESGLETTNGTAALIDRTLAASHPTSSAHFAAAARAVKAGRFTEAADHVAKARQVSEPATFRIVLRDPYFAGERWRPEFHAIYAEAFNATPGKKEPETDQRP